MTETIHQSHITESVLHPDISNVDIKSDVSQFSKDPDHEKRKLMKINQYGVSSSPTNKRPKGIPLSQPSKKHRQTDFNQMRLNELLKPLRNGVDLHQMHTYNENNTNGSKVPPIKLNFINEDIKEDTQDAASVSRNKSVNNTGNGSESTFF